MHLFENNFFICIYQKKILVVKKWKYHGIKKQEKYIVKNAHLCFEYKKFNFKKKNGNQSYKKYTYNHFTGAIISLSNRSKKNHTILTD